LADCFPFDADTYNALVVKVATLDPTPLLTLKPDIDPELAAVVMRAMAREREERYQSAAELAQALLPFAAGVPFRAPLVFSGSFPAQSSDPLPTLPIRRPRGLRALPVWKLRAFALGALLLLAGGTAAMWSVGPPAEQTVTSTALAPEPLGPTRLAPPTEPRSGTNTVASSLREAPSPRAEDKLAHARRRSRSSRLTKPSATVAGARSGRASQGGREPDAARDWDERIPAVAATGSRAAAVFGNARGRGAGNLSPADL
jgi:serine/threonine-protein kinase